MAGNDKKDIKETETNSSQTKKATSTNIILIVGIVVILAAVAVVAYFLLRPEIVDDNDEIGSFVLNEDNYEELMNREEEEPTGPFNMIMNMEWNFPAADKASSNAYVANSEENKKPFYLELTLEDTDELIYTSSVVPVGKKLKEVVLDKQDLEPGRYVTVCKYNFINSKDEVDDYVNFNVVINIE